VTTDFVRLSIGGGSAIDGILTDVLARKAATVAELSREIPQSVFDALNERQASMGNTTDHIVTGALADALPVGHTTLFQVSSAGALVEGASQGPITIGELARHGDFGLGTFVDFDGEMIVVDGVTYQVTHEGVNLPPEELLVPFAVVTHFLLELPLWLDRLSPWTIWWPVSVRCEIRTTSSSLYELKAHSTASRPGSPARQTGSNPLSRLGANKPSSASVPSMV